ncbi:MAG: UDP-N-acetyl-D-glucosamine 2-epimerase, UDP-hydrolyzing [Acidobacteria bacterium]|nr:UDP-N-acetyl-D-glucosamine 2-epimerase, UDP-hydrolyzing [Acidobacteriota bacterium]
MTTMFASTTRRTPATGKRRICFPITSRAYYGRSQLLLQKLQEHPGVELELMLGGSVMLDKYSRHIADDIEAGGFTISTSLFNVIEGGNHVAMAKTACLTALEFTNGFHAADPDIVVICGDRFEQLAIAMAAAYLNKTIAHIEGGDVTGSIDESVRHAITKLAHLHFVTNDDAHRRVLAMGEDPKYVFTTGSLDVEVASMVSTEITSAVVNSYGVGHEIDVAQPFLLVIQHPVTTEHDNRRHLEDTLRAVSALDMPAIWIWPNPDAGTGEMADSLRHFRENVPEAVKKMRFITDVPVNEFIALLKVTSCLVGNSSAGIKECSYLGTPVVNIGARQQGRLHADNVAHAAYDAAEILAAVRDQLARGRYAPSHIYHRPGASQSMVDVLASVELYTQKRFYESPDAVLKAARG